MKQIPQREFSIDRFYRKSKTKEKCLAALKLGNPRFAL